MRPSLSLALLLPLYAAACSPPSSPTVAVADDELRYGRGPLAVDHVLLLSVDGLHAVDLLRFVAGHPQSALARLGAHGVTYANASAARPSDSFPGLLALVTGGSPASTGVYYDDSYDRDLSPPGSDCSTRGTEVAFDESIDVNPDAIDAGGGIDPAKLPRDPDRGCAPVYPHDFLRVNTVFEVVRDFGGRTAWSDKHPAYDLVNGPSGRGVDDLYTPEINADGITSSEALTEAYDDRKVGAILNQIAGWNHDHTRRVGVPTLFGMNFPAVSVGQKTAGYLDGAASPTRSLGDALEHTDASIGKMLDALAARGLDARTLVVVTAKHGQSPIDPAARRIVDKKLLGAAVDAAQITADDAAFIWLNPGARVDAATAALEAQRDALAIDRIYFGPDLDLLSGAADARRPDLVVQPRAGVIYAKPTATKLAEHGGFADDDLHVALVVSNPRLRARAVTATVATAQVAPTALEALGLPADLLASVVIEGTSSLPLR
jgi:predicted AlkP superfamily pyrophosphatase or phosphodiesterase